jgi:hypothetical protein
MKPADGSFRFPMRTRRARLRPPHAAAISMRPERPAGENVMNALLHKTLVTTLVMAFGSLPAWAGDTQKVIGGGDPTTVYVARLHPLNAAVTGHAAAGEARFAIHGDSLTITVHARGTPPAIEHWQHLHGFADARTAVCPSSAADVNGDRIIDLMETAPMADMTMVPLHDDPVSMDIPRDTYPRASASGDIEYRKTVSLSALQRAFEHAFPGQRLDLDRRVFMMHGVPATTTLPATVASLGTIPAQVTLPIACGTLVRQK